MGLTMKERQKVVKEVAARYRRAAKKQKGTMLDEFVELTGYHRAYASCVLKNHGRVIKKAKGLRIVLDATVKGSRRRQKKYGESVHTSLRNIWAIMDHLCGKRLGPALKELVPRLEELGELTLDEDTRRKLLTISPATIDRMMAADRKKFVIKGRSGTKPGTLLKHQIPIRTFSEWDEARAGFLEIDLVGHDGGSTAGEYLQTLTATDVATGWTEIRPVRNKAQIWVFEALKDIRRQLPFELLGIDSDNGSEFINNHLIRYCTENRITFTRSRSYRKNDNCFVEQKNYSVVRRAVGYSRFTTPQQQRILEELYADLRLYANFFQPVMKLIEKTRVGSKVKKKYDEAKTPYQRVLDSPYVSTHHKQFLRRIYNPLNPAHLKRNITRLQNELLKTAAQQPSSIMNLEKQRNSAAAP